VAVVECQLHVLFEVLASEAVAGFVDFGDSEIVINQDRSSGLSQLNLRVDGFEFDTGVVDFHLPIDSTLDGVNIFVPCGGFFAEFCFAADAATGNALTRHAAEFIFGDVEPAAMFWGVVKFNSGHK
jgi:hypothetical protein